MPIRTVKQHLHLNVTPMNISYMKQSRIARSNAPDCLLRTKFFSYNVHSIEFNNTRFRSIYNRVDFAVDNLCKAEICQKNSSHVFKIIAGLDFLNEPDFIG